ncbi:MAG: hypothetical protein ABEJ07_01975 [Candidatus Nanohaloarchaea archaeon]
MVQHTAFSFSSFLEGFAAVDGFTVLLPFLLSFVVFQAAASRLDLLDSERTQNILALIMSFFVAWFLVQNPVYQGFFAGYIGRIAIGAVGILGFLFLLGMFGFTDILESAVPVIIFLIVAGIIGAFTLSGGIYAFLPSRSLILGLSAAEIYAVLFDSGLIYILLIGGFMYWTVSGVDEDEYDSTLLGAMERAMGRDNR